MLAIAIPVTSTMIRQASSRSSDEGKLCWCGEPCTGEIGNFRMGCRCLVHYDCLVSLLKSWSSDFNMVHEWGIACPYGEDCLLKQETGRSCYISEKDIISIVEYGQEFKHHDHDISLFLEANEVERIKGVMEEKCHLLSCGCYVHFDELLNQLRPYLDTISLQSSVGIECPRKVQGTCTGVKGMYIHLGEIERAINYGAHLSRKRLLPTFITPSLLLRDEDKESFGKFYHRHIHLGCGCFVHCQTLIDHIRRSLHCVEEKPCTITEDDDCAIKLEDCLIQERDKRNGSARAHPTLSCPHSIHCTYRYGSGKKDTDQYQLRKPDIEKLLEMRADLARRGLIMSVDAAATALAGEPIMHDTEIESWMSMCPSTEDSVSHYSDEVMTGRYTEATTKGCPQCGYRQTHYHGHACHHVKEGCFNCKVHFCYRCLSTASQNRRDRGSEGRCLCGGWSNWCSSDHIVDHLSTDPVLHDTRCGCPICPECRPGKPCQGCSGSCVVCTNLVQPGPSEMDSKIEIQTPEQRALYEMEKNKSEMFSACRSGDDVKVVRLLSGGVQADIADSSGLTPLHWASICGRVNVASVILESLQKDDHGPNSVVRRDDGLCTPLHYASQSFHTEIVRLLLDANAAAVDTKDRSSFTPLDLVVMGSNRQADTMEGQKRMEVAKLLMERGAYARGGSRAEAHASIRRSQAVNNLYIKDWRDACTSEDKHDLISMIGQITSSHLNVRDATGTSAVMLASATGHLSTVQLLAEDGACLDFIDQSGKSALMHAIENGHHDVALWLVDRSVHRLDVTDEEGCNILHYVTEYPGPHSPELLCHILGCMTPSQQVVAANQQNNERRLPVLSACCAGSLDIVVTLLRLDERSDAASRYLSHACQSGQLSTAKALVEMGADPHFCDSMGRSSLMIAIIEAHVELATWLLQTLKVSVVNQDNKKQSALAYAILSKCGSLVPVIMSALCDSGHSSEEQIHQINSDGYSVLHLAVQCGDVSVVQYLVEQGADIEDSNPEGHTAIHAAARMGHMDIFYFLLSKGANPDVPDYKGKSLQNFATQSRDRGFISLVKDSIRKHNCLKKKVFTAASHGDEDRLREFAESGCLVSVMRDSAGLTALMTACQNGGENAISFLLENRPRVNAIDKHGRTALFHAAAHGHVGATQLLIQRGAALDVLNKVGTTALYVALGQGHFNVAELLVQSSIAIGIDSDQRDSMGRSSLMHAILDKDVRTVIWLLDHTEISLSGTDAAGSFPLATALLHCTGKVRMDIATSLLARGADVNQEDSSGQTALALFVDSMCSLRARNSSRAPTTPKGDLEIIRLLVTAGASLNLLSKNGKPLLFEALVKDQFEAALLMVECGMDVNMKDAQGISTIRHAVLTAHRQDIVEWLLAHTTVTINDTDNDGRSLLHAVFSLSLTKYNLTVPTLLLAHGADINQRDQADRTAYMAAVSGGEEYEYAVQWLLENGAELV